MLGRSDIKKTREKRCGMCGARFQRRRFESGRLEDLAAFMKRQFCSLSCANSRTKGGLSRKAFHAQARKQRKPHCECCGTSKRREVHHVNEDWTDNSPANLQTLCIFCHTFWHAMHRRLGLKPNSRMPAMLSPCVLERVVALADSGPTETRSSRRSRPK